MVKLLGDRHGKIVIVEYVHKGDTEMKRNARFELRMTQEEMGALLLAAGEGKRSEFIRKAIKVAIRRSVWKKLRAATKETK